MVLAQNARVSNGPSREKWLRTAGQQHLSCWVIPDPAWLKHSIWESQLPYIVQLFDEGTLIVVRYAYSLLHSVPAMISPKAAPTGSPYAYGGWVDEHLNTVRTAFQDADQALENLRKHLASETLWQKVKSSFFEAWK